WQRPDTTGLLKEIRYLLSHKRSFNLYVIHGGTNFGYTAGANAFTPVQFQPDVTSYDYDAPVNEQGQATPKYYAIRNLIQQYVSHPLPEVPAPVPVITIEPFDMQPFTSLWNELPAPVLTPQPVPIEKLDQKSGFVLYRTKLIGPKSGKLTITEPHDYALVYLDGKLIDTIYRDGGKWTINLPATENKEPVLDILVEAMGHINFAQFMIDRKGITDRVTLNGITLTNWQTYSLPMDDNFVSRLEPKKITSSQKGIFFKGSFDLNETADTYLDLSHYHKGVVWVNGHNLGRFWDKGPQFRLYCPAGWLKKGKNEVRVLDLLQEDAAQIQGVPTLY
ncbi:MAG TPA: beta-galactosidase, partial [Flavisolibacter sp.]|nr:beta-galactosidase [Flavisolibacter sp.]